MQWHFDLIYSYWDERDVLKENWLWIKIELRKGGICMYPAYLFSILKWILKIEFWKWDYFDRIMYFELMYPAYLFSIDYCCLICLPRVFEIVPNYLVRLVPNHTRPKLGQFGYGIQFLGQTCKSCIELGTVSG